MMWRLWCYALGKKEGRSDGEANAIALMRTVILLLYMITNFFIVAGVVRHWNDGVRTEGLSELNQCYKKESY